MNTINRHLIWCNANRICPIRPHDTGFKAPGLALRNGNVLVFLLLFFLCTSNKMPQLRRSETIDVQTAVYRDNMDSKI